MGLTTYGDEHPADLVKLVSNFQKNFDVIKQDQVEASTRVDYINPLLELLGWDVKNVLGKPQSKREVIYEPQQVVSGHNLAPDYCLTIEGKRKIYIEAKRVSENILTNRNHAYQLKRYSWNAGLPFGILTDFEEIAIYDCRFVPMPGDSAEVGRVGYFKFSELLTNWKVFGSLFSREAVANGSLEAIVQSDKLEKGTKTIDSSFLDFMKNWRKVVAQSIASCNPSFDETVIDYEAQALLNKIIFLRILEDRGLEASDSLRQLIEPPDKFLNSLTEYFQRANDRYNSGLFSGNGIGSERLHDVMHLDLSVEAEKISGFISNLYYPNPYEFSVMPPDILGQIYELMLAEDVTIANLDTREIEVSLKPEIKKRGGVFYTPVPIVEYIIEETVGPLILDKTPATVKRIRIVDPACGSGSFLVSAYQYLIDFITDHYLANNKKKLIRTSDGSYKLSLAERRAILENCIFGVDIDAQAVEVSKLSLLLKLVEEEEQFQFDFGHLLPNLDMNLKSGNSLVDEDFPRQMFDYEFDAQFNPFSWKKAFPDVFKDGGFDAVIGNPPYLNIDAIWGTKDPRLSYIKNRYPHIYTDKTDVLFYFLEKSVSICKGEIGMIVSRSFLEADKAFKLREWLSSNSRVREILDFRTTEVFKGVGINTAIINLTKSKSVKHASFKKWCGISLPAGYRASTLRNKQLLECISISHDKLDGTIWNFGDTKVEEILAKLDSAGEPLSSIAKVGKGMETGSNKAFEIDEGLYQMMKSKFPKMVFPRISNSGIKPFQLQPAKKYLLYPEDAGSFEELPEEFKNHLSLSREELEDRAAFKRGDCEWWRYTWPLHKELFHLPKVVSPYMATTSTFAVDTSNEAMYLTDTTVIYITNPDIPIHALCALLNSDILDFRFHYLTKLKGGGVKEFFAKQVERQPIPFNSQNSETSLRLNELGLAMSVALDEISSTQIEKERHLLRASMAQLTIEINQCVAKLFGITSDELAFIRETKASWT
jgi:type I restriction-modification system DNA methylase subunit